MMSAPISEVPLGPSLSEEAARAIFARGEDAVVFALLVQAKMLAEQQAHCPRPLTRRRRARNRSTLGDTDLRDSFDYASSSTLDIAQVKQFAILVISEEAGARVLTAAPPAR